LGKENDDGSRRKDEKQKPVLFIPQPSSFILSASTVAAEDDRNDDGTR